MTRRAASAAATLMLGLRLGFGLSQALAASDATVTGQAGIAVGRDGHFDQADGLLAQAEARDTAYGERKLLNGAKLRATRGANAMTEARYCDAARHYREAAARVPPGHPDAHAGYLLAAADALRQQGDERGDNQALIKSIKRMPSFCRNTRGTACRCNGPRPERSRQRLVDARRARERHRAA